MKNYERSMIIDKVDIYIKDGKLIKYRGGILNRCPWEAVEFSLERNDKLQVMIEKDECLNMYSGCGYVSLPLTLIVEFKLIGLKELNEILDIQKRFKKDSKLSKEGFKVGDEVLVTNRGRVYSSYKKMKTYMNRYCNSEVPFEDSFSPEDGSKATILYIAKHESEDSILLGIECEGRFVIIRETGVCRVKTEVVEERAVKTQKTFFELMADHKPNQVWKSDYKTVKFDRNGDFDIATNNGTEMSEFSFNRNSKYTLQEDPKRIDIHEALKERANGKTIRSCVTDITYNTKGWCNSIRIEEIEGEWTVDEQ